MHPEASRTSLDGRDTAARAASWEAMVAALMGTADATWSYPVSALSRPAWQLLGKHSRLPIHSVFSAAVNLRAGDRLVTCTSSGDRAPHGIDLPPAGLDRLRQLGRTHDAVVQWRTDEADETGPPLLYDPAVPSISGDAARVGARELLDQLTQSRPATGFGASWPELVADPDLVAAIASVRRGQVDDAVTACLGRGPGLTPSGDDVLVGALAASWSVGAIDPSRSEGLMTALEAQAHLRTSDVSVEYLHYACRGMTTGAVRALLTALGGHDFASVADAVARLRRFGHTSGMDTLLGIVIALTRTP